MADVNPKNEFFEVAAPGSCVDYLRSELPQGKSLARAVAASACVGRHLADRLRLLIPKGASIPQKCERGGALRGSGASAEDSRNALQRSIADRAKRTGSFTCIVEEIASNPDYPYLKKDSTVLSIGQELVHAIDTSKDTDDAVADVLFCLRQFPLCIGLLTGTELSHIKSASSDLRTGMMVDHLAAVFMPVFDEETYLLLDCADS